MCEVPANMIFSLGLWRMPPACTVECRLVEMVRQQTREAWGDAPFLPCHGSVSERRGCLCSHPTVVWAPLDSLFEQGGNLGPMDGSREVLVGATYGSG